MEEGADQCKPHRAASRRGPQERRLARALAADQSEAAAATGEPKEDQPQDGRALLPSHVAAVAADAKCYKTTQCLEASQ